MNISNVIIIVILIIVLVYILIKIFVKPNILYDKMLYANQESQVDSIITYDNNRSSLINANSNFTMSVWFYIDEWSQNTTDRNILYLNNTTVGPSSFSSSMSQPDAANAYDLSAKLGRYRNSVYIDIKTTNENTSSKVSKIITRYNVDNIPIQKWNCLTVSVQSKTMDIYLGGKLIKSYILPGIFVSQDGNNIFLGKDIVNGGFEGYITRVRFLTYFINPEESYQIYRDGINSSLARSLFNKYRLKLSFLELDQEKGSIII